MRSRRNCNRRRGFKLNELMVIVFVVAVLMAIYVSGVNNSFVGCRRYTCQNNLRQLGLGLVNYQASFNYFPNAGTFLDDPAIHQGDPLRSNIYRAIVDPGRTPDQPTTWLRSWVVEILPYLDRQDEYNAWNMRASYLSTASPGPSMPSNAAIASTAIGVLRCPDDFTAQPGQGNLSYVVNGGFARWPAVPVGWAGSKVDGKSGNGALLRWVAPGGTWEEGQEVVRKLGVMFPGTQTGDQPWDVRTRPADIVDGAANTLLVAENFLVGDSKGTAYSGSWATNWACPLPNFTTFLGSDDVCCTSRSAGDCLGGQLRPGPKGATGKGWARANRKGTFENINFGQRLTVEGSFPFANIGHQAGSAHRGGANFVFCDGAVGFLSDTIDGAVYAELITPAGTRLPPGLRQAQRAFPEE